MSISAADPIATRSSGVGRPRRFFFWFSLALLVVVFVGFAPSFYLRGLISLPGSAAPPPMPTYVYVHGVLMTSWYLLFVVQTRLASQGRRDLHRPIGVAGGLVAAAIVPLGWLTTERSASRFAALSGLTPDQLIEMFSLDAALLRGLIGLGLFAGCVATAVLWRKHVTVHGRLMLLAGLAASGAALAPTRMIGAVTGAILPPWLLAETVFVGAAVLALVAYDWRTLHRVHRVTMIVGSLLLLQVPLASALAATAVGQIWFFGLFATGR